ncbi:transcriptional protein SWT1 isoform X2 [Hippocampus zosterae]|uniref:transcriptional protein SWT1 isoform X2 n=1 Tax=Hippocampus zosterae TaxID=109293 RepID=UPI00223CFA04|nr:transcriptional protein SWT1 isoform X2 [Hippocampus zosterae]
MSENSRKRKRKRSSKEEEKTSKDQQKSDRSKSKYNEKRHSRKHKECTSHVEEESRQIKKAVYKHHAREETGKRQEIQTCVAHSKSKSTSLLIHPDYPHKVQSNITVKDKINSGGKIKERCPSRSRNIKNSDTDGRKEEKDSQYGLDEKAHHMSPPRLKKQQTSPSSVSEERWKHCQCLQKSKDKELHKNRNESKTIKTKEQSQTSRHSKYRYSIRPKQTEIIKETCQELLLKEKESRDPKTSPDFTKQQFSLSTKAKGSFEFAKSSFSRPKIPSPVLSSFKIPKKVKPELVEVNTSDKCDVTSISGTATCTTERTVRKIESTGTSSSNVPPTTSDVTTEQTNEQMQVAEELHLARFERKLEVDVMQCYGELTCMDIDPPEERATHSLLLQQMFRIETSINRSHGKQSAQQDVILVLDTNILLSNLDYVKKIQHCGLGALGLPIVLIPWVVLQELDSLKKGKGLTDSVAHLACPAISYIYNALKRRESHLWGQSMQQAAASNNSLMAENNDDKVLQCCLQYQSLYPDCALILCTNDKNLCSKAVLSGVKAFSKLDLEEEVEGSRRTVNHLRSTVLPRLPQIDMPMPGRISTPVLSHTQERLCLPEEERKKPTVEEKENIKKCVSEFENCLQEVLSNVLEMEMKATYDELWQEIIYIKPPWNLLDILHCLKKHWRAVFGFIVSRSLLQTVLNLIDFFKQGILIDHSSILVTLQQAKEFVKEFGKRSSHVPRALNEMDNIAHKLTPQPESAVCDVVMNEDDEAKRPLSSHVPHHEVWAMFENIWCKACEIRKSALPEGGPAPPRDAVDCLGQMSSMVSQLLQAFISVLSSSAGLHEVQMLLTTIRSNKMVDINSRLVDTDLLSCFLQEDYREKLRVGVNQLTELKDALDDCVQTTSQHLNLIM